MVSLRGVLWTFDGNDQRMSFSFKGERISPIWFCHTSWREATAEQLNKLKKLGFRLPDRVQPVKEETPSERVDKERIGDERPVANLAFSE